MRIKTQALKKRYAIIALIVIATVIAGGWIIYFAMGKPQYGNADSLTQQQLIDEYFNKALAFMVNKQYPQAVQEWNKLLVLNAPIPEAYANLGFSLFELEKYQAAKESFLQAIDINPYQVNAYYGLAICHEKLGDIHAATGAMRSYIHLAKKGDPFIRKARSALWEWESQLNNPEPPNNQP
ncbi:MAG: tetratricopeptide repeat protein [Proteobacteria bacterium]|nr:tetratricopeptide repeat protein [Pseudomonadota bacterium]